MKDDSCSLFCKARSDGTITCKFNSSISPYIVSLALLIFLLLFIVHQQENPSSSLQIDESYGAKLRKQSASGSSTRRGCRGNLKSTNAIHFSAIGRKGGLGRHNFKVYESPSFSWRDKVFNDSAHEVPSGPNPNSNR